MLWSPPEAEVGWAVGAVGAVDAVGADVTVGLVGGNGVDCELVVPWSSVGWGVGDLNPPVVGIDVLVGCGASVGTGVRIGGGVADGIRVLLGAAKAVGTGVAAGATVGVGWPSFSTLSSVAPDNTIVGEGCGVVNAIGVVDGAVVLVGTAGPFDTAVAVCSPSSPKLSAGVVDGARVADGRGGVETIGDGGFWRCDTSVLVGSTKVATVGLAVGSDGGMVLIGVAVGVSVNLNAAPPGVIPSSMLR